MRARPTITSRPCNWVSAPGLSKAAVFEPRTGRGSPSSLAVELDAATVPLAVLGVEREQLRDQSGGRDLAVQPRRCGLHRGRHREPAGAPVAPAGRHEALQ